MFISKWYILIVCFPVLFVMSIFIGAFLFWIISVALEKIGWDGRIRKDGTFFIVPMDLKHGDVIQWRHGKPSEVWRFGERIWLLK